MKLYFNPRSRAVIAKWMLDECGAQYELVPIDLQKREHKTPEFLAINPAGKLPALVDGETRVFENAAICLYLGDKFPEANLAPRIGAPERGRYLSLVVYSTSQLEPSMGDVRLNVPTQPQRGWTELPATLNAIERELGQGPWLFGDWFTAADIMIGSIFIYMRLLNVRSDRPAIEAYVDRLMARPRCMKL
ncbi:glutathione S-transferase family protein [Pyxidicoccus fallax]|uniref:Glutathione S-transferase family protein n=1 Tax=Pyxidicoccus fallax TaxID=394095 RepID=A0A848LE86_9BACT|nr:glutathione S-transferase family protein [Pyxidicoccus fallax]NMO15113.1 glutathione S-transferase family protein [Pyxidicoccus fallax]NPC77459.1 glutathione S-transferase family protein [Pyxidicoccus fallax]